MPSNRNLVAVFSLAAFLTSVTLAAQAPAPAVSANPQPAWNQNQPSSQAGLRVFRFDSNANQVSPSLSAGTTTVYAVPAPASLDCPVSMRAQRRSFPSLRMTRDLHSPATVPQEPAQHIHLSLGSAREPVHVAAATVTVHGTGSKWRLVPATQTPDASPYIQKTFNLTFPSGRTVDVDEEAASSNLVLAGFTSVQSITLDSLTYADGSLWTPSAGRSCRTVPDLLMLVDSR